MLRKVSVSLGAALLAISFTGVASATDSDPYLKQTEVSYSDLNLAHVSEAKKLYSRIWHAARDVCRAEFGSASRTRLVEEKCFDDAIADAVRKVSDPNLTAVYMERTGKRSMVASSR